MLKNINRYFLLLLAVLITVPAVNIYADGSKDLHPSTTPETKQGAAPVRALLYSSAPSGNNSAYYVFPNHGVHFVYAKPGERITLASSAQGSGSARIRMYAPNGTEVVNTASGGQITNRTQELAGPQRWQQTGGNRYTPIYYQVPAGGEGVYRVEFRGRTDGVPTQQIAYTTSWASNNQGNNGIIAWDVSVINSDNTAFIPGRVYTTILNLANGTSDPQNFGFYGKVYVRTRDGYTYLVDNNGSNGICYSFFVNNNGFINADGSPQYKSLNYLVNAGSTEVQNPDLPDTDKQVTHKMFYTKPATDLPPTAQVTLRTAPSDNASANTTTITTWLKNEVKVPTVEEVKLVGAEGIEGQVSNKGGNITFQAGSQGNYRITIESTDTPKSFSTRMLTGASFAGDNIIYWDGKAGTAGDPTQPGLPLPAGSVPARVTVQLQGAEVHFPFFDMEYNKNGIIIELLDHTDLDNKISDLVYWDDRGIQQRTNGTNSSPQNNSHLPPANSAGLSSITNGHIWGRGATGTANQFGDSKSIDTWTFIKGEEETIETPVSVRIADLIDNDGVLDGDTITWNITELENTASATVFGICPAGKNQVVLFKTELSNGDLPEVGESLFFDDFGTSDLNNGDKGRSESPYMPSNGFDFGTSYLNLPIPGGQVWDNNPIRNAARLNDGFYAVVAPGYINEGWFPDDGWASWWTPGYNQSNPIYDYSGTETGAALVINAGNNKTAFYERTGLIQPGAKYKASFKLFVVQAPAQVGIDIIDPVTFDILYTMQTDKYQTDYKNNGYGSWREIEIDFVMPGSSCNAKEVIVSFRNHFAQIEGNDWYVDNIRLEKIEDGPICPPVDDCVSHGVTYVNLNNAFTGTVPSNSELVWYSTADRQTGTKVDNPEKVSNSGNYYAFFYSEEFDCYNTEKSTAKVEVLILPPCTNYWMGGTENHENDWNVDTNWTANRVPEPGENIEFATEENNNGAAATDDLYLDNVNQDNSGGRIIGNLINDSEVDLVITAGNQLIINGEVTDNNAAAGTIVVKSTNIPTDGSDPVNAPTGTLIVNPAENPEGVRAVVEFYNQAYDCEDCGFYTRSWQYFGIPVKESGTTPAPLPFTNAEEVNEWSEPTNGDKWIDPDMPLTAFTGYQITRNKTSEPDHTNAVHRFDGGLNIGDATVGLTRTDNVNYPGVNLVGNSYTAAIPISEDALTFPSGVQQTVYLFNTGTRDQWRKLNGSVVNEDGYRSGQYLAVPVNLGGQDNFPDRIPSMHAFMLLAESGTGNVGNLGIDYSELIKNTAVNRGDGSQIVTRSAGNEGTATSTTTSLPSLVMDVIGEQSADRVWIFAKEGASHGFDNGWDGRKMAESGIAQLYVTGSDESQLQVATVPTMENVLLGFEADADGKYTLEFSLSEQLNTVDIHLQDLVTGMSQRLSDGGSYQFEAKKGDTAARFRLSQSGEFKAPDDEALIDIEPAGDGKVMIRNHGGSACTAFISNDKGAVLQRVEVSAGGEKVLENMSAGVYVIRLQNATVNDARRVVVN